MAKLAIDLRSSLHLVATLGQWFGLAFLAPLAVALIYGEPFWLWLLLFGFTFGVGWAIRRATAGHDTIELREGVFVVTVGWVLVAGLGSLPYLEFGALGPVDAVFESMSGFTTTGSTVLTDIEGQARSLLFWRSLTQWLGGMGIIVLAMALLPQLRIGGRQLVEAELPGYEVEKLTPRIQETAKALWGVYVGFSVAEVILLLLADIPMYEAVTHTFTNISTGGFSPNAQSVMPFPAAAQWIVILFMLIGGSNFALFSRMFRTGRSWHTVLLRDGEYRMYWLIYLAVTLLLVAVISGTGLTAEETVRQGAFQVATMMTATGFANVDFNHWGAAAQLILLFSMFIGGCASSTTGSIKVFRWWAIWKFFTRELRSVIHPRAQMPIRLGQRTIRESAVGRIVIFIVMYLSLFVIGSILVLFDVNAHGGLAMGESIGVLESMSAVAATLGNVGPGFGAFGPMASFAALPVFSKLLLTGLMWIGRLEIFPVLMLFMPSLWRV